ncbi:alpha-D-ribose 1-methylphosphonate 5-triphosphate synthase subunit PhnG [Alteribacillus persepolensis]|uniref:Alpha-D-ribose 1-methylphosphonate 5-triphosphate synthase subunit PhnG n=1 Tax=Alteribacillus persepolensis TaxID=568899 RepID=A0A1G8GVI1_9BACI|nr:phosphonate C-P lyase system protein PhnG [Alteribacillus persepolensis]SDH98415.1 alpha-D-ribose 1-methylphosphonate 5-triphosphate synthase subunit PhnG [Alteribacillus persepolensis]
MNRRRRTKILIDGDWCLAKGMADEVTQRYNCQNIIAPRQGLTMVRMRESAKKSLFYIGEVLVTEAKVELNQCIGIGIVVGIHEEMARQLAVIDAAYKAELPETKKWEDRLLKAEQLIKKEKSKQQTELFETTVNFETMDV